MVCSGKLWGNEIYLATSGRRYFKFMVVVSIKERKRENDNHICPLRDITYLLDLKERILEMEDIPSPLGLLMWEEGDLARDGIDEL